VGPSLIFSFLGSSTKKKKTYLSTFPSQY
jgi:hypothetical protein